MVTCAPDGIRQLESRLAEKLGPQQYNLWFRNATAFAFAGNSLRVSSPNPFIGDWIEKHFTEVITQAAREVTGNDYALSFAVDPVLSRNLGKKQPDRQLDFVVAYPERMARRHRRNGAAIGPVKLRGELGTLVVGPSNRLAHAAALRVVESPGREYNPLFIHGGCGLGKTHLLQGICNAIRERNPEARWRYVAGEEFTNEFVCATRTREQAAFRERFRYLDVLVIDDVHFLANKKATQEEFLNTFNAIDVAGKQVILASDAHPKVIGQFSDSLVSRFLSGMVVRIDTPDVTMRAEILRRRAARLNVEISERVILYIAENFRANVRELEGALLKVLAQAQLSQEPITLKLAERAIQDLVRQTAPVVMLSDVESIVSIYFGLCPADLHTSRKPRTIALARGIVMYLARKHTKMSFPEIGRYLGNKNHSTVILAARRISGLLQSNATVRWLTHAGVKEQNLASVIDEIEEQFGCERKAAAC